MQALIENDSQINEASVIHHSDINNKKSKDSNIISELGKFLAYYIS